MRIPAAMTSKKEPLTENPMIKPFLLPPPPPPPLSSSLFSSSELSVFSL
jgi:hypothetical protein